VPCRAANPKLKFFDGTTGKEWAGKGGKREKREKKGGVNWIKLHATSKPAGRRKGRRKKKREGGVKDEKGVSASFRIYFIVIYFSNNFGTYVL